MAYRRRAQSGPPCYNDVNIMNQMESWFHACKPAAPARMHLLFAAMLWTGVGGALVFFGARWALAAHFSHGWLLLAAAVGVGLFKSRLVLRRTAKRTIGRILTRGDDRCIGGFLSWRTWLFVALMMGLGRALRGGLAPRGLVGVIYVAVGAALLLTTPVLWRAWHRHPPGQ
jgi:hypothetical protein